MSAWGIAAVAVVVLGTINLPRQVGLSAPQFSVVSVKGEPASFRGPIDLELTARRFIAKGLTLNQLIEQAYDLDRGAVAGGPEWTRSERFEVIATTDADVTQPAMRRMLQALLAARFHLELGKRVRTGTVYRLEAPHPRNLSRAGGAARPLVSIARFDGDGYLSYAYVGQNATMDLLCQRLAQQLGAPVANQTHLAGGYDFSVRFRQDATPGSPHPDLGVPWIAEALESELGLKLVREKGPIVSFVVRSASEPSPN